MEPDLSVPEQPYSFGTLALAQALGDLQSLHSHQRPAVRISLGTDPVRTIRRLVADSLQPQQPVETRPKQADRRSTSSPSLRCHPGLSCIPSPMRRDLVVAAADLFVQLGQRAIAERNRFLVALSGGSTPKALYAARLTSTLRNT